VGAPMLNRRRAKVLEILSRRPDVLEILVDVDGERCKAICYPDLTGEVSRDDEVLVNTTALDLGLGTGGFHFVICNLSRPEEEKSPPSGRIMKLRYTPVQRSVVSVEEDDSFTRRRMHDFVSLDGMPVVCCELHSQIAPVAAAVKTVSGYLVRIAYLMTDGAALPLAFSRLVKDLKSAGLIDRTITCGQAFGGDFEAINVYTGLIATKQAAKADIAIVSQGPGNAGTGSKYGFSGIQQGEAANACSILGGTPIIVPRISFADSRERHRPVSHHTVTILSEVALFPCWVPVPNMPEQKLAEVTAVLKRAVSKAGHKIRVIDADAGLEEMARKHLQVKTMGRSVGEDREFFLAGAAAGVLANELLRKSQK